MLPDVVSVSELIQVVQDLIEDNFVEVLVQGELANLSRPASGHRYFTMKDTRSQVRCVQFRSTARLLRFQPEDGMEVICRGRLSVYTQRGDIQLIVEGMEPVGLGGLQLAFQQLKDRLQQDGYFDPERKRALPAFPLTVGVVTSATGAAIQDILNILQRRSSGLKVLLRPVSVQGETAAPEIAEAIAELNAEASSDVLIVGRGGGSLEDLWAFNEEVVALAIAASNIPVISAVGHEVDTTIADLVADLRAPTPSAAAELVVKNRLELEQHLDHLSLRLQSRMQSLLSLQRSRLDNIEARLRSPLDQLPLRKQRLSAFSHRLAAAMEHQLELSRGTLGALSGRLDALSPLKVLDRGYALVSSMKNGEIIRDSRQVSIDDELRLKLARGELQARVITDKKIEKKNGNS
ncbi:MAG TPA: exodeoxyribonuclease VII large subunit [Geopsychrobacteraceae bacterium]|nr:exodeoxyribonuclease VII large subunit [Geopsychrobacteraceae bacterium]